MNLGNDEPAATSLAFSPDGDSLIAGTNTGRIMCWDLARQSVTRDWAVSPGERQRILRTFEEMLEKSDNVLDTLMLPALASELTAVHGVAVSPAGGVICAGTGRSVNVMAMTGKHLTSWRDGDAPKRSVSFHGDGQEVAYLADDKLRLRDLLTGRITNEVPMKASPGFGDHYAVGCEGTSVAVAEGSQISVYQDQTKPVVLKWRDWRLRRPRAGCEELESPAIMALSLGPVRDSLAILSFINDGGALQRWTLGSGQPELLQPTATGCVGNVVRLMSADQTDLVLAQDKDGAIRFWDSRTDATMFMPLPDDLSSARMTTSTANQAGTILAAAFAPDTIAIWHLSQSQPKLSVLSHPV